MKRKKLQRRKPTVAPKLTELRKYIASQRMTQAEFAKKIGVTQGAVWQWIEGKQRVSAERVLSIEDATAGTVTRYYMRSDLYPSESRV
jgi:DNA-binding transcriptional regulator YdaS (Cro superfamily)